MERFIRSAYVRLGTLAALWAVVALGAAYLVRDRYDKTLAKNIGTDFTTYLQAARAVSAGHSPYVIGQYVYPPTFALLLSPFSHLAPSHLWKVWTVLELGALIAAVAVFVIIEARRLQSWKWPVLFGFCAITVLHFWPVTVNLMRGQANTFVLAVLMVSALCTSLALPATRGIMIGVAGLVKAWPAASAVSLFQRGSQGRGRAISGFVATVVVAPILALCIGGWSGLVGFFKNAFDARTQRQVSDSVWGAPKLLFSHSRLARPLLASTGLQTVLTVALLIWVVGLLVVNLRMRDDQVLGLWNTTLCVVLLLPVSHLAYTLYAIPILWVWGARVLRRAPRLVPGEVVVVLILLLWWLLQTREWPDNGSPAAISSLRYCIVFAANLMACSASTLGGWLSARHKSTPQALDYESLPKAMAPASGSSGA